MLASVPADIIRHTLGVGSSELASGTGTELAIINDCCRILENKRGWKWLETRSVPLSIYAGEPYINLPDDFREVVSIESNPGLLRKMQPATWGEILQHRTNSIQSWAGSYLYCPRSEFVETKNLLSYTEDFSNVVWVQTGITLAANDAVGPAGEASGEADKLTATSTSDKVRQTVSGSVLKDGHDYMFSVYLKNVDAVTTRLVVGQLGVGGGESSTQSNRNTVTVTWDSDDAATASGTTQGTTISQVRVADHGDGWYRVSVGLTWDARQATAADNLGVDIFPDVGTGTLAVHAWGAQLEEIEVHEDPWATRYEATTAAYTQGVASPEWRLSIWPTPSEDSLGDFVMVYRKKLPTIAAETDQIPIPDFCEPLFVEMARLVARGYHEEDQAHVHVRLEPLWNTQFYADAVRQDDTVQDDYGPMRGLAKNAGVRFRNWDTRDEIGIG